MAAYRVLRVVGIGISALPLLACLLLSLRGWEPTRRAWTLAAALGVSLLADLLALTIPGNDWWITYAYVPVQFALLALAVTDRDLAHVTICGVLVLGLVVAAKGPMSVPETVGQAVGGAWIAVLAWTRRGPYTRAIGLYCGLGIFPILMMGWFSVADPRWLPWWASYQAVRVLGIGAVLLALVEEARRVYGRGGQGAGNRRPLWGRAGAGRLDQGVQTAGGRRVA